MADGHAGGERAKFREMLEGTKEDWDIIAENSRIFNKGLAKRVLDLLTACAAEAPCTDAS